MFNIVALTMASGIGVIGHLMHIIYEDSFSKPKLVRKLGNK